jgi:hypothetical protein
MRLILDLYDVHTACALANNVPSTGFELSYRPALLRQTPRQATKLPLKMAPTLAVFPISRAQRLSVNGRALSNNQDLRRLRRLFPTRR